MKMKRLRGEAAGGRAGLVAWGAEPATGRAPLAKAVRRIQQAPKLPLARTELIDKAVRVRFEEEIDAVLKRKPTSEAKIAGALRAVAPLSPALRASLGE